MIVSVHELFTELKKLTNIVDFDHHKFMPYINTGIYLIIYFLIGILITLVARWFVGKITEKNISAHHAMLFRRITLYLGLVISILMPLKAIGFDLTIFGVAAGFITAAVAFASQTSISNFLSGVFLLAEKPFVLGDFICINDMLGEVLSIDLLSIKIRTRDNTMVRIPNENLLKSQFRNVSRFPIRRFDVKFRVYFDEDLVKLQQILLDLTKEEPLCLVNPAPELSFLEFGESGIQLMFSVWGKQSTYTELQTRIQSQIQNALKKHKVSLPATNLNPVH